MRCGAWQQSKGTFAYSGAASFRALIIHGSMTDSVYSNWLGVAFEDVRKETLIRTVVVLCPLAASSVSVDVKYQIWRSLRAVREAGAEPTSSRMPLAQPCDCLFVGRRSISRDRGIFPAKRRHSSPQASSSLDSLRRPEHRGRPAALASPCICGKDCSWSHSRRCLLLGNALTRLAPSPLWTVCVGPKPAAPRRQPT